MGLETDAGDAGGGGGVAGVAGGAGGVEPHTLTTRPRPKALPHAQPTDRYVLQMYHHSHNSQTYAVVKILNLKNI